MAETRVDRTGVLANSSLSAERFARSATGQDVDLEFLEIRRDDQPQSFEGDRDDEELFHVKPL
jgi:hypothetical protein